MPKKTAAVDFDACHPDRCQNGICVAAQACERKLLRQEAPYEAPMTNPSLCQGCSRCVLACPLKAIRLVGLYPIA